MHACITFRKKMQSFHTMFFQLVQLLGWVLTDKPQGDDFAPQKVAGSFWRFYICNLTVTFGGICFHICHKMKVLDSFLKITLQSSLLKRKYVWLEETPYRHPFLILQIKVEITGEAEMDPAQIKIRFQGQTKWIRWFISFSFKHFAGRVSAKAAWKPRKIRNRRWQNLHPCSNSNTLLALSCKPKQRFQI